MLQLFHVAQYTSWNVNHGMEFSLFFQLQILPHDPSLILWLKLQDIREEEILTKSTTFFRIANI